LGGVSARERGKTMKASGRICLAILALSGGFAAGGFTRPEASDKDTSGGVARDDRVKLSEVEGLFAAGKFDAVADPARSLLRTSRDETVKTGAARLIAESLRKKGDWKGAAGAYAKLAERYEKGSEEQVKAAATGEVLLASPSGVYPPLEAAGAHVEGVASSSTDRPAANLSDDAYLARALACLGSLRAEKVKSRVSTIKKARTPQETQAIFAVLAEELRQARILSGSLSADAERSAAGAAGKHLADLGRQIVMTLNAKLAAFQDAIKRNALTLTQRKDMESCQTLCTDLAKTEGDFQATTDKLNGLSGSSDGAKVRGESAQREAEYAKLARLFVPPPIERRDWGNWRGGRGFDGRGDAGRRGG